MKTTILISGLLLATTTLAPAATNDPTAALQRGLFEEEANHNLPAAIQAYQSVIDQFDQDRKLAATAVFRLGECYRRQGETNKAGAQYERVLREFSDQTPLVTLSQQSLAGMGMTVAGATTTTSTAAARQEQKRLLEEEVKLVEKKIDAQQRQIQAGIIGQDALWATQRDLLELKRQVAALDAGAPIAFAAAEQASVAPTNEEAEEVRRIQAMIKDSPDLINAKNNNGWTPLYQASMKGQIIVATFLLQHGADVDAKDYTGNTPLYAAAAMGHRSMVEMLIQHHADVKSAGAAALHAAASKGFRSIAELLLANGADVNAKASSGSTALHMAVANGFKAVAELLLAQGADVNAVAEDVANGTNQRFTGTPLHIAAQMGDTAMAELLLDNKANIEATNKFGQTALLTACAIGQVRVAHMLLSRGANLNAADTVGMTPLFHAVRAQKIETLRLLLMNGASPNVKYHDARNPNQPQGDTPLLAATRSGPSELVRLLLDHKADPNARSESGDTPLSNALRQDNTADRQRMATALLDHGADVNARDRDRRTPLQIAVLEADRDSVRLLLTYKADVNVQDSRGSSALHLLAGSSCNQGVAEDLLAAGANVNVLDKDGRTPLNIALATPVQGHLEFADFLRRHGAAEYVSNPQAIEIRRGNSYSANVFSKGTNDWNQFRLLDLLAVHMGLLSGSPAGETRSMESADLLFMNGIYGPDRALTNPDFSRVRIRRPAQNPSVWKDTYVDVSAMLQLGECSKNLPLDWGDVVEIPPADRPRGNEWRGFGRQELNTLMGCLARKVTVSFGGASTNITLRVEGGRGGSVVTKEPFWIRPVLYRLTEKMEPTQRASLDFAHVKVSRRDPASGEDRHWVVDCSTSAPAPDLWLLDGDTIDVPSRP